MPRLRLALVLFGIGLAALAATARAGDALPAADDPALERRAVAIAEVLRCLVCQNQNIADSHADLALDLKKQIRAQLKSGASDQAVIDYMVARYGDFVLYRPPFKASTVLLWLGPFLLLLGAFGFLVVQLKRRRSAAQAEAPMNETEHARARALLDEPEQPT